MKSLTKQRQFSVLINGLKALIKKSRYNAVYAVNAEMLYAYFEIGKKIVEEEQKGSKRAGYGKRIIDKVSFELTKEFGRGFDVTNLRRMRRFYLIYLKWETVSPKLAWSHYCELIKIEDGTNNVHVDFAAGGLPHKLFVSKYQLYLPTKEELEREVRKLL